MVRCIAVPPVSSERDHRDFVDSAVNSTRLSTPSACKFIVHVANLQLKIQRVVRIFGSQFQL